MMKGINKIKIIFQNQIILILLKKYQFLNILEIQNNVITSVVRIIINAAKEDKYFCLDELIIIAEENLNRLITERK